MRDFVSGMMPVPRRVCVFQDRQAWPQDLVVQHASRLAALPLDFWSLLLRRNPPMQPTLASTPVSMAANQNHGTPERSDRWRDGYVYWVFSTGSGSTIESGGTAGSSAA